MDLLGDMSEEEFRDWVIGGGLTSPEHVKLFLNKGVVTEEDRRASLAKEMRIKNRGGKLFIYPLSRSRSSDYESTFITVKKMLRRVSINIDSDTFYNHDDIEKILVALDIAERITREND